jgi:hypothetical protein
VQILAFATIRRLFNVRAALWGVLTLSVTPLAVVGGFVFTYDALLILFWALGIYGLTIALQGPPKTGWLIVGLSLGLGLLSKLTMALFVPCALLFLLSYPKGRVQFKSPWPWLALGLGTAIFLPNLLWQIDHDWATLRHMSALSRATLDKSALARVGDFIGSQMAVVSPFLFMMLLVALWIGWGKRGDWRLLYLWCFSAPVLGIFFVNTLHSKVLANWPAAGWYSICLIAAIFLTQDSVSKIYARLFKASLAVAAFISAIATYPEAFVSAGLNIPISWNRPSNKMFGGPELGRAATEIKKEIESKTGRRVRVIGTEYQQIGRLGFYLEGQPHVPCFYAGTRLSDYVFRTKDREMEEGEDAVLVLQTEIRDSTRSALRRVFDRIGEHYRRLDIYRPAVHKEPVRGYYLYHLIGYRKAAGDPLQKPSLSGNLSQ